MLFYPQTFGVILLNLAAVFAIAGCSSPEDISFHYRLTAEIETPEGIRLGSGVLKVVVYDQLSGTKGLGGGGLSARGEAIAVDLPNKKTLFVMLRSATNVDWAASAFVHARDKVTKDRREMENASTARYVQTLKSDGQVYTV